MEHAATEAQLLIFLLQILVLLGCARGLGEVFRRIGQPPIIGEMLVGVIFGPSILGRAWPDLFARLFPPSPAQWQMLEAVSEFGVLFLLLVNGLDVDVSVAWKQRKDSFVISVSDVFVPLAIGFTMALFIPGRFMVVPGQRLLFAYVVGTAVTIGALPVAVRALHDINILKTDLGLLILSALTVNDIIGWVLFTIAVGLAAGNASFVRVSSVVVFTLGFTAACLTVGRTLVDRALRWAQRSKMPQPGSTLTLVVLLGLLCGSITQWIGVHALFGFFLAGVMAGDSSSLSERTKEIIDQMVYSIFVPLFFVFIGVRIDFLSNFDVLLVLVITLVSVGARYAGAWLGSLGTSIAKHDRNPVAIAHTAGGAMAIVIALIALDAGVITRPVFVAIVFSAIASSLLVGPWLAWSLKRRHWVRILDFFLPRAFRMDLESREPLGAIRELCDAAAAEKNIPDAPLLFNAVADRERTKATAIGQGIAFPHARLTEIASPRVVMGLSHGGIDWDAPDGLPVRWVFMILTPADDLESQVTILAELAAAMSRPALPEKLLAAKTGSDAWEFLRKALSESGRGPAAAGSSNGPQAAS